ncbi:MAG: Asp-tRNA(Asn)/Glu-tRNA(Gln) amidotransferase subunit GatC [Candidatus Saccharibacteria bacterium]|nr:Asp-tRNA(Asn)/Glu-tRNA(Gln) amidotransferase subunit GatC [Candidatus Saccharibacteria bacterium]
MDINREELKHLADLSNFSMSDEELDSLQGDLKNIVNYISELNSLDTEGVEPTYQVFEMENVWRNDEIKDMDANREELLNLTVEEKENQIKVPKVL